MLKRNKPLVILISLIFIALVAFILNKFVLNKKIELAQEPGGSINILLLGKGGGTHEGPDLTDTIILANINSQKNKVTMLAVPRDLWIPDIKGKINKAYAIGQENDKQGILLSKAVVSKVTGQDIDYAVVIDFSGFVKIIDYLGGVDVQVDRTLDDYAYPLEGKEEDTCGKTEEEIGDLTAQIATASAKEWDAFPCRYKHLHVEVGKQHMNGQLALEFSRSRHGINGEGTDFARSQRQQKVIAAVRDKVLSVGTILNPIKIIGIFNILRNNIDTNIKLSEFDDFINLANEMQDAEIESYVIDFGDKQAGRYGLLIEPVRSRERGFQAVLTPRIGDGNFSEIHDYFSCITNGHVCEISDEGIIKDPLPSPPKR
jgi:LCP family protein required for cell wall assembly